MDAQITLALFSPAEAEKVTGVGTALQRDWRRRGYLPAGDGHARFDIFDLSRMYVMKLLSDRGIGPALSHTAADWCAAVVTAGALSHIDAWEGEPEKALTWHSAFASPPPVNPILAKVLGEAGETIPEYGSLWEKQFPYLIGQVWQQAGRPRVMPASVFIWWADGSHHFDLSFDNAIGNVSHLDPKVCGPIVIIDLNGLGFQIVSRSPRPFVHVEFIERAGQ